MGKRAPLIFAGVLVVILVGGAFALYRYDAGRDDLMALRSYEESSQARSSVVRAIDRVLARREPAGTR